MKIELYDHDTVGTLEWPSTPEADQARALLLPMLKEGVSAYIRNVETKLYLMQVNSTILPITVNQHEYENSYLTSNYFPIKYLEEKLSQQPSNLKKLQKPIIKGVGFFLKKIKINKAIIINNWLLTTNIYPQLKEEELAAVTEFLTHRFPDHTLIFRSLNTRKCGNLAHFLSKQRYRLLYARDVFIYDPQQKNSFNSKVFYHHRRDRRLIGAEGYEIIKYESMSPEEITRLLQLYNFIYLIRHTKYGPQYTEKFLKEAAEKGFLQFVGIKKEGKIHGIIGFHERDGTLIAPFLGYDRAHQASNQIYRLLTILAIDEAEKRNAILNDGSGGETAKYNRGMQPFPEYIALYDRHLPFYRRMFWATAETLVKWIKRPNSRNR